MASTAVLPSMHQDKKHPTVAARNSNMLISSCSKSVHASVGMVIGGRAARACDVCGKERARWYCAADEAYLCERCDGSVHTANTVAKRHERVRLGLNGAPIKIDRSSTGTAASASATLKRCVSSSAPDHATKLNCNNKRLQNIDAPSVISNNNNYTGSRKRPRSIRRHNTNPTHLTNCIKLNLKAPDPASSNNVTNLKIKTEPNSCVTGSTPDINDGDQLQVPDFNGSSFLDSLLTDCGALQDDDLFVPIYMPLESCEAELPPISSSIANSSVEHEALHSSTHDQGKSHSFLQSCDGIITGTNCSLDTSEICTNLDQSTLYQHNVVTSCIISTGSDQDPGLDFFVSGNHIDIEHFLESDIDHDHLCDLDVGDVVEPDETSLYINGMIVNEDHSANDTSCHDSEEIGYADDSCHHAGLQYADGVDYKSGCESPRSWLMCKVKVEEISPQQQLVIGADEYSSCAGDGESLLTDSSMELDNNLIMQQQHPSVPLKNAKLGLNLDLEDVLNAWADKGTLWMAGQRPDETTLESMEGWLASGYYKYSSCAISTAAHDEQQAAAAAGCSGAFSIISGRLWDHGMMIKGYSGAREARVMRYKEKRRTRLFSKKIRYQVRKLNAEKRPRMKGRFVKRSPSTI